MHIPLRFKEASRAVIRAATVAWLPMAVSGQGLVNVNNSWGTPTPGINIVRPVVDSSGSPLAGTNFVAQIVYGASASTLTNLLGAPMPLRNLTTPNPRAGTWNAGAEVNRVLEGFREGDLVTMQVYVWDAWDYPGFAALRELLDSHEWIFGCRTGQMAGRSTPFNYRVGRAADPFSLNMENFTGVTVRNTLEFWPPHAVEFIQGGRWLGSVVTNENSTSITQNFLERPELGLTTLFNGGEPFGAAFRSVAVGNPLNLTRVRSSFPDPFVSETLVGGSMTGTVLETDQDFADTDLVSISGTVSNAVIRVKRPFLGRVELVVRHLPQAVPGFAECIVPTKFVIDLRPAGNPNMLSIAPAAAHLRVRLDSGRAHRLLRSTDLAAWEALETFQVGFPGCQTFNPGGTCWVYTDRDEVRRSADFELSIEDWLPTGGARAVFFRLESQ